MPNCSLNVMIKYVIDCLQTRMLLDNNIVFK